MVLVRGEFYFQTIYYNAKITILEQTEFKNDDEYLRSIKGMEQSIIDASGESNENFVTIDKLDW